jgi:hypothetical protein
LEVVDGEGDRAWLFEWAVEKSPKSPRFDRQSMAAQNLLGASKQGHPPRVTGRTTSPVIRLIGSYVKILVSELEFVLINPRAWARPSLIDSFD